MNVVKDKVYLLFLHYAIPSILGMLAISSASIVDGLFVGNYVGSIGLAAINISLPVYSLLFGVSLMLGVGSSVISGKLMGEGDSKSASDIFSKTFIVVLLFSSSISTFLIMNLNSTLLLLGANEELLPIAYDYLSILLLFMPFLMVGIVLDYFVKIDNRPLLAFTALLCVALLNILLDWLFVVYFNLGIKGAAYATGISHVMLIIVLLPHFFSISATIRFIKPLKDWSKVIKSAYNGASEFVNETSIGITTLIFNYVMISRFGVDGVAAFTVVNYIIWVGIMVSFAISDSLQPLISKNFGAKEFDRIRSFVNLATICVFSIGLLLALITLFFPETILNLFLEEKDKNTQDILLSFMAIIWPVFLFNGINMVISAYFTAMHKPIQSAFIAISRSLIFPVSFIIILPIFMGDKGLFLAIVMAEITTFIIAISLYSKFKSHKF